MIIARSLAAYIQEIGKYFPVISLTGPRQSGKTTLLQYLFNDYRYVSFEDPEYRERFNLDPRGFLDQYDRKVIFDEAQRVPDLFSYLQGIVDQNRTPARFILSGSQNFLLMQGITQSLAGRVGMARLLPLDRDEIVMEGLMKADPWDVLLEGFYPVHFQIGMPPHFFYPNYLATYLERDLGNTILESNQIAFRRFLQYGATLAGQTINLSSMAKAMGLSVPTVKQWLAVLEQSFIIFMLPPFVSNIAKRLVKSPKLYFYDTGLLAYLLELTTPDSIRQSRFRGPLFENLVIADRVKRRYHAGETPNLYFFRDSNGLECDLVETRNGTIRLTEIKASSTFQARMAENLEKILPLLESPASIELVYGGTEDFRVKELAVNSWLSAS